jgi:hypothetical protein
MLVLKLKHWQIFLIMLFALLIMNTTIEGYPVISGLLTAVGGLIWFGWLLLTGNALYQILPPKIHVNHTLYLINSFLWLGTYVTIMIISDGQGMTFDGLQALPMFYVFFAFLHFLSFPVKTLRSIEKGREAAVGEYIGDFFLLAFLPIGVWFLQPRINMAFDKNQTSTSDLTNS